MSNKIYLSNEIVSANTDGLILDAFFLNRGYFVIQNQQQLNELLQRYEDKELNCVVYVVDDNTSYLYENGVKQVFPEFDKVKEEILSIVQNGYVPLTRTIAGISLDSDIDSSDLTDSLNYATSQEIQGLIDSLPDEDEGD